MVTEAEKEHYRWDKFESYAGEQGISLEHMDDWLPWWNTWVAGINAFAIAEEQSHEDEEEDDEYEEDYEYSDIEDDEDYDYDYDDEGI